MEKNNHTPLPAGCRARIMDTEVTKIRIDTKDKERLVEIAEQQGRTLASQVRIALKEWLEITRMGTVKAPVNVED